jgi:hypothetical protein
MALMVKRVTNLLLILAVGGSVSAGIPLHSGSSESGMMNCCKKALEENNSPQVAAARLCCAMNCDEPGPVGGNTSQGFSQSAVQPSPSVVLALPQVTSYKPLRARHELTESTDSKPAYILYLALLI